MLTSQSDHSSSILTELADGILTVTLNRPDKLNAFDVGMRTLLIEAFDAADRDDDVRVVILTGAGRGFCAGADLSGGPATFDYDNRPDKAALGSPLREDGSIDYGHAAVRDNAGMVSLRAFALLKPIIAAINGPAIGAGLTMTLPMDIRMASTTARFGLPFTRRGVVPEAASAWFLPRLVGISRALEWCASGRIFDAEEAREFGLVRSIHQPDELLPAARQLALSMCEGTAPVSVALTRQMLWRGLTMSEPMEAHRVDSRGVYVRGKSADAREGLGAFLAKREPAFPDRVSSGMPAFFPWWDELSYG
jgi:enoyl-CoA hydratase/carnithine racemase